MRSIGPSDFVLVLSETVLVIVIEKQLWLTNWVLDFCRKGFEYEQEHEHEHEDCQ